MWKKGIFAALIVLGLSLFILPVMATNTYADNYYVSPAGNNSTGDGSEGDPWRTISYAVGAVNNSDTIKVMDDDTDATDDYVENIAVDKSITLERYDNNSTAPRIKASNAYTHVIHVTADNVTIKGLDIYGATHIDDCGILVDKRSGMSAVMLTNVTIEDCRCGWDGTHFNTHGIYVNYLVNGSITNNTCSYNSDLGILQSYKCVTTISGNTFNNNGLDGIKVRGSDYSTAVPNSTIINNVCLNNAGGMRISYSNNNLITGNNFSNNSNYGLWLYSTSNNNTIYRNNFSNNITANIVATTGSSNIWSSPTVISYHYGSQNRESYMGNYYSDYSGSDGDGDGIGDTPYDLPQDEPDDDYPLVQTTDNYTDSKSTNLPAVPMLLLLGD